MIPISPIDFPLYYHHSPAYVVVDTVNQEGRRAYFYDVEFWMLGARIARGANVLIPVPSALRIKTFKIGYGDTIRVIWTSGWDVNDDGLLNLSDLVSFALDYNIRWDISDLVQFARLYQIGLSRYSISYSRGN